MTATLLVDGDGTQQPHDIQNVLQICCGIRCLEHTDVNRGRHANRRLVETKMSSLASTRCAGEFMAQ
jgi:hypothetical protein